MSDDEMNRYWNLCVFTPGINLVALCVLIGRKLGGVWGIVVSLVGFLVPSAGITAILTALFALVEHVAGVQAVLRGVVPATAGLMFLVALRFFQPLALTIRHEGWLRMFTSLLLITLCVLAIVIFNVPVILVVFAAAVLGAFLFQPHAPVQTDIPDVQQVAPTTETGVLPND
jgi:chromate transporter